MRLAHHHLPGLSSYAHAATLQNRLVQTFLTDKALRTSASLSATAPPQPTVLTAEFNPVYTCGRREAGTVSQSQEAHLRRNGTADFYYTSRGGQTTFHGPGQLVAYPILDLKRHGLSPRCYINLLEEVVIRTCARYGVQGFRTENPGVWTSETEKVCAVGVHLRRNVSSHGIGLNISTDLEWFNRVVACGLEDKRATNLERLGVTGVNVPEIGEVFVEEFSRSLQGVEQVMRIKEDEIPP